MNNHIELIQQLISVGDGSIAHIYAGSCPNALEGEGVRDPECPACQVLARANLAAPQQEPMKLHELQTVARLVDKYDSRNKLRQSVYLSPLTDRVTLSEADEANALCLISDAQDAMEEMRASQSFAMPSFYVAPTVIKRLMDSDEVLANIIGNRQHCEDDYIACYTAPPPAAPALSDEDIFNLLLPIAYDNSWDEVVTAGRALLTRAQS